MIHREAETVSSIPAGLIACRLDGIQAHIVQISPRSLLLRTPEDISPAAVELIFRRPETGEIQVLTIQSIQTGEARRENGAVLTRFYFEDPACASEIRRAFRSYARYVEIRSEFGAGAYGKETMAYPWDEDDRFHASVEEQRRAWFSALPPLNTDIPLAVELNCPELWELYLKTPIEAFPDAYAANRYLPDGFFSKVCISRLYVGSALCSRLIPEIAELEMLLKKAEQEALALTLVTAELRAGGERRADALLGFAAVHGLEVVVNDWGMLQRAQSFIGCMPLLLGTQLNRRRRDPRLKYKSGLKGHEALLAEGSLNSAPWREQLERCGISRYEYESCGLALSPPDADCSLHLPFYQTNTGLWCPLQALCERGSRGAQRPSDGCPRWCSRNTLLYPAHLNMIGCWNSILALDTSAFSPEAFRGFDRLILNF